MAEIVKLPPDNIMEWYQFDVPAEQALVRVAKYSRDKRMVWVLPKDVRDFIETAPGRVLIKAMRGGYSFQSSPSRVPPAIYPVAFDDLRAATMFKLRFL